MKRKRGTVAKRTDGAVLLYHAVYSDEGFDKAAHDIHTMIRFAARKFPGLPRHLYMDIDGHRNEHGGFDHDMYEIQQEFLLGTMSAYLTEIHVPLINARNPKQQSDDVPEYLFISPEVKE